MPEHVDYVIDAIRLDSTGSYIEKYRVQTATWDEAKRRWIIGSESKAWSAIEIVVAMYFGSVFKTLYNDNRGARKIGSLVEGAMSKTRNVYLRTNVSGTVADNLENLPPF